MKKIFIPLICLSLVSGYGLSTIAGDVSTDVSDLGDPIEIGNEYNPSIVVPTGESRTTNNTNNTTGSDAAAHSYVDTSPVLRQSGYQSNTQYNTVFGIEEWPTTRMDGVGEMPNAFIGVSMGYADSGYGSNHYRNGGYQNGYEIKLFGVMPLGSGIDGQVEKLANARVKTQDLQNLLTHQEALLKQGEVIAMKISNWTNTIQMCTNLKRNYDGTKIVTNYETASTVIKDVLDICNGMDVVAMKAQVTQLQKYQKQVTYCTENPDDPRCRITTPN